MADRTLTVTIVGDSTSAQRAFRSLGQTAEGFGGTLRRVGETAAGFLAANVISRGFDSFRGFIAGSVDAASDLNESLNAVQQIFGEAQATVLEWGEENATAFGLSQRAFNEMAVPMGAVLQNLGFEQDVAADKTIELTKRAADMASVFNTDVQDALDAINSALRGEADPIERYGVSVNQAAVNARALADTGKSTAAALTAEEKAVARLALIFEQTDKVAGDFINTSDEFANSQRIAEARTEELQAQIGQFMIPVMEAWTRVKLELLRVLAERLIPALAKFHEWITERLIPAVRSLLDWVGNQLGPAFEGVARFIDDNFGGAVEGLGGLLDSTIGKLGSLNREVSATSEELAALDQQLHSQIAQSLGEADFAAGELLTRFDIMNRQIHADIAPALGEVRRAADEEATPGIVRFTEYLSNTTIATLDRFGDKIAEKGADLRTRWEQDYQPALDNIARFAEFVFNHVAAVAEKVWPAVEVLVGGVLNGIGQKVEGFWDNIVEAFSLGSNLITGDWEGLWNGILHFIEQLPLVSVIIDLLEKIAQAVPVALEKGREIGEAIADGIAGGLARGASAIGGGRPGIRLPSFGLPFSINVPIPGTAHGGIVTSPQVRLVGEAGPEAIVPLGRAGGFGETVVVNVTMQGSLIAQADLERTIVAAVHQARRRGEPV